MKNLNEPVWYVLKGEQKFGPYSQADLIKMLQEKLLYDFDYIWQPEMDGWKRLAEVENFQTSHIREIFKSENNASIFLDRECARAPIEGTVLITDQEDLYRGRWTDVSVGGAGVIISNSLLLPGQILNLQFRAQESIEHFNAVCEVVSKRFVREIKRRQSPLRYGLKFQSLRPDVRVRIKEWIETYKTSAGAA